MKKSSLPEWVDEDTPSPSLKPRKPSSSVKSGSTPELKADGVLGESGCENDFCMTLDQISCFAFVSVVSLASKTRANPEISHAVPTPCCICCQDVYIVMCKAPLFAIGMAQDL